MNHRVIIGMLALAFALPASAHNGALQQTAAMHAIINHNHENAMTIDWEQRYREYTEVVFNRKEVDRVMEYWTPDFTNHDAPSGLPAGPDGVRMQIEAWLRAFPDTHVTVEDIIVSGDRLAARVTIRGTHSAEFAGFPPTGKMVTVREIAWYRLRGDRLSEIWPLVDVAGMIEQLKGS